jgi:hypothetical protein
MGRCRSNGAACVAAIGKIGADEAGVPSSAASGIGKRWIDDLSSILDALSVFSSARDFPEKIKRCRLGVIPIFFSIWFGSVSLKLGSVR